MMNFADLSLWLCKHFIQFGVPEVIKTDGGPLFNGAAWKNFLAKWGISHYLSLAMYPESNSRVKVAKRLIRDKTGLAGNLNTNNTNCSTSKLP